MSALDTGFAILLSVEEREMQIRVETRAVEYSQTND
jgi:hypothetical protein